MVLPKVLSPGYWIDKWVTLILQVILAMLLQILYILKGEDARVTDVKVTRKVAVSDNKKITQTPARATKPARQSIPVKTGSTGDSSRELKADTKEVKKPEEKITPGTLTELKPDKIELVKEEEIAPVEFKEEVTTFAAAPVAVLEVQKPEDIVTFEVKEPVEEVNVKPIDESVEEVKEIEKVEEVKIIEEEVEEVKVVEEEVEEVKVVEVEKVEEVKIIEEEVEEEVKVVEVEKVEEVKIIEEEVEEEVKVVEEIEKVEEVKIIEEEVEEVKVVEVEEVEEVKIIEVESVEEVKIIEVESVEEAKPIEEVESVEETKPIDEVEQTEVTPPQLAPLEMKTSHEFVHNVEDNIGEIEFHWKHGGSEVFVTGDFDKWSVTHQMHKDPVSGDFVAKVAVDRTKQHEFKFVVDNNWLINGDFPTVRDEHGNENNVIYPLDLEPLHSEYKEYATELSSFQYTAAAY